MTERRTTQCLAALVNLSLPEVKANPAEARHAIDRALACDRYIHCSQRLHCTWLAAELAECLRVIAR